MHRSPAFLVRAGTCSQRKKARHALHERARHLQLPRLKRSAECSHRRPQAPLGHGQRLTAQQQPRALDGTGFGCAAEQRQSVHVRERKAQRAGAAVLDDGAQLRRAVTGERSRNRSTDVASASGPRMRRAARCGTSRWSTAPASTPHRQRERRRKRTRWPHHLRRQRCRRGPRRRCHPRRRTQRRRLRRSRSRRSPQAARAARWWREAAHQCAVRCGPCLHGCRQMRNIKSMRLSGAPRRSTSRASASCALA